MILSGPRNAVPWRQVFLGQHGQNRSEGKMVHGRNMFLALKLANGLARNEWVEFETWYYRQPTNPVPCPTHPSQGI